ncbi:hypothetical protein RhiirA1_481132 [Rhizophagus irregularis]|uniref:DNA-directed DNA polymerase n=1 Tax=Rhizophagus irregularis TaxID=588596 RepID=A0A2N0QNH8_9GLOM|nr:hypothetical protein RhiirA1_481132 [Rhizophagus irregularis]GET55635.1 DNA polymerase family B-domain-containing protein [Rhizophagus irregularis DAOM 181602=DAOM 197198]
MLKISSTKSVGEAGKEKEKRREMEVKGHVSQGVYAKKGEISQSICLPPEKGIEDKCPIIAFDFASLYPSIIMAYNLCERRKREE